jgi:hypothetical protein
LSSSAQTPRSRKQEQRLKIQGVAELSGCLDPVLQQFLGNSIAHDIFGSKVGFGELTRVVGVVSIGWSEALDLKRRLLSLVLLAGANA